MSERSKVKLTLPPLRQVGVVVRNLDRAIEYYSSNFGIGPFYVFESATDSAFSRGKTGVSYKVKLGIAPLGGGVDLELVELLDGESIHREFLEQKGEGVEHLAFVVDDIDAEIARFEKAGFKLLQSGRRGKLGTAYIDTAEVGGFFLELIQKGTGPYQ